MVDFMLWFLESSLLILFVLGIRKIFSGKISYRAIYTFFISFFREIGYNRHGF